MKKLIVLFAFVFTALTACMAKEKTTMTKQIKLIVNGTTFTATLAGNSSAEAFARLLEKGPLTLELSDYGNFEKVGSLGTSLPRNDTRITTVPGDIILYHGNQITIYYDKNTWSFTRLGRIDDVEQSELKAVLGKGGVTVTFEK